LLALPPIAATIRNAGAIAGIVPAGRFSFFEETRMLRKCFGAAVVLLVSFGLLYAEEFGARITKVDGNKIEITKGKKGEKGEASTLTVADNVKVVRGKFNDQKKVEAGEALPEGLKNEVFKKSDKGVFARITTDDDGKVTQIVVIQFKKKNQ
jgi:hypothetical protein